MRPGARALLAIFALATVALAATATEAHVPIQWSKRLPKSCEPPNVFYSSHHIPGRKPCCPVVQGVCGGGQACPVSGVCAGTSEACVPGPATPRPNIVLMISDDQGACHYGTAGECRSVSTGTAIPAPVTPNLDLLAGHGTVFPIAHNSAPWCFPSLTTIVTGRYQRNFHGVRRVTEEFGTIATSLRSLDNAPDTVADPYNAGNRVGGYCTLIAGKLAGSIGEPGFDARAKTSERVLGRTNCVAGPPGEPPLCGSDTTPAYDPVNVFKMGDLFAFLDSLLYRVPDANPVTYAIQNFFVWYAPRIPHQPLRSPPVIREYLFGKADFPLGGVMDLGALCSGPSCGPDVTAFNEVNFGDVHEMYGNVWWMDDSLREIRKFLAKESEPHCLDSNGKSRFDIATPAACPGTWVENFAPNLPASTVIMFLSDNGWHLPESKHRFTENAYRTRLIVFDPRNLPTVPSWDASQETPPPAQESPALAHAVDIRATAMAYALGSANGAIVCPLGDDGQPCDGKDLLPHLLTAPGGPAAPETLRRSMCGHETKKATTATTNRYLLTRPGSVGRCTNLDAPACADDGECAADEFCLGGHCMPHLEPACSTTATCPTGAVCLGGKCRSGPSCLQDSDCAALFPGIASACVQKETLWCRNDPSVACTTRDDCPACADGGACSRLCEPRIVKFYLGTGSGENATEMTDLFLDPDEVGLHKGLGGVGGIVFDMSKLNGPYGDAIRRANCCVDAWWPEPAQDGTACTIGMTCPADLTCNE